MADGADSAMQSAWQRLLSHSRAELVLRSLPEARASASAPDALTEAWHRDCERCERAMRTGGAAAWSGRCAQGLRHLP